MKYQILMLILASLLISQISYGLEGNESCTSSVQNKTHNFICNVSDTISVNEELAVTTIKVKIVNTSISKWDPSLPYADMSFDIHPIDEKYDKNESLHVNFNSVSGYKTQEVTYDTKNKKWIFPNSGTVQIMFDYNSWFFPLSSYKTRIIVEDNIMLLSDVANPLLIPGNDYLSGTPQIENKNEVLINVFYNWNIYIVLILSVGPYLIILLYAFKKVIKGYKIPSFAYFIQLLPLLIPSFLGILPLESFLFLFLVITYACFWACFFYKKYYKIPNKKKSQTIFTPSTKADI